MTRWFPTVMMKQKMSWKTKALQLSQNRTESTERQRSSGSHPGKVTSLGLAAGSCPGPSPWGGGNRCTGWPVHLDGPGGVSLLLGELVARRPQPAGLLDPPDEVHPEDGKWGVARLDELANSGCC